ncbi:hypothetical protein [Methylobacterium planeticum]|uniref:Uncharacterized protein n=1 Tax=Methylobacterium planeticum TaxID=2615211 RepID=A0A6N6MFD9_9HYPH|nr:hypothetical protein [Methylobacterium planeticum]KAB1069535.1 hypothetical protein F6X51_25255 [Methylobacterium planeticum]
MPDDDAARRPRTGAVAWAVRISAVAILVGCGAAQYLAKAVAPLSETARIAAGPAFRDPETTGSITVSARSVALDPCGPRPDAR